MDDYFSVYPMERQLLESLYDQAVYDWEDRKGIFSTWREYDYGTDYDVFDESDESDVGKEVSYVHFEVGHASEEEQMLLLNEAVKDIPGVYIFEERETDKIFGPWWDAEYDDTQENRDKTIAALNAIPAARKAKGLDPRYPEKYQYLFQ